MTLRSVAPKTRLVRHARSKYLAHFDRLEDRTLLSVASTGFVDTFTTSLLSGWAADADVGNDAIQVRITIDGTSTDVLADINRPDGHKGFNFAPNLSPGKHKVTISAIDPQTSALKILRSGTLTNNAPTGTVAITSTEIFGSATDKDAPGTPLQIRIDVNGITVDTVTANANNTFTVAGDFDGIVNVFAIDQPSGQASLLKTTNLKSTGKVETFTTGQVTGYVSDPDRPDAAIVVRVLVDGEIVAEGPANIDRPGVKFPNATTTHGFSLNYVLPIGTHTVQVVAVESDTSSAQYTVLKSATLTNPPPTGGIGVVSSVQVVGFAIDKSNANTTLTVEVKVDGVVNTTAIANQAKPAGVSAKGAAPGNHWFTANLTGVDNQPHIIEIWTTDIATGISTKIAQRTINNAAPQGVLEIVSPSLITGAAFDPNTSNPILVVIEIDGVRYSPVAAAAARPDLPSLPDPNHGFSLPTPTVLFGNHTVRAIAIDSFDGSETVIGTKKFNNRAPTGKLETATQNSLSGYAYDLDSPSTSIEVLIRIDGTIVARLPADDSRPDLVGKIGSANHGFTVSYSGLTPGKHKMEVFGVDPASGVTKLIGSKFVTATV